MNTEEFVFLLGRILFAGYFFYNAYFHLFKTDSLAKYAESKGVFQPRRAVLISGVMLAFGAYTILAGVRVNWGVSVLALFFILVTYKMHDFWKLEGEEREKQKSLFLRNLALLGATLMLLAIPSPWPVSLAAN